MSDVPPIDDDEASFSELWRDTLERHRRIERWRALRFRSAAVGVAATLALAAHASPWIGPEPAPAPDAAVASVRTAASAGGEPVAATAPAPVAAAPASGAVIQVARDALRAAPFVQMPPTPVIYDTDMVNGIDDPLALAALHGYARLGMVDLLAVTISHDDDRVASYVDALNTAYGHGDVPIAGVGDGGVSVGRDAYHRLVADTPSRFPRDLDPGRHLDDAVVILRRTLAAQDDATVVMISTGHATNLARLLASPPDGISPLSGRDLVAAKVTLLAVTAGDVARAKPEHNTATDPSSTRAVFDAWPTPIVASEWQVGAGLAFPASAITTEPLLTSAKLYGRNALLVDFPYDPPSFDLTTVLAAVEPDAYFTLGPAGRLRLDDQLVTRFDPDPDGRHRLVQAPLDQGTKLRVIDRLRDLVSPPM